MSRVLFLDTVHSHLHDQLTELGYVCVDCTSSSKQDIVHELKTAHGIVIRSRFRMDASILDQAPLLKWIARSGAGMENIDLAYCAARDIQLFNAPEGNRNAVAEQALGMLLTLFNNVIRGNQEVRKGIWDREGNRGIELEGKTVGIIGFGNNGSQFAQVLSGFDCSILAYDKYKSGYGNDRVQELGLDQLLEQSDIISLHIPETDETRFMFDAGFINLAKKPFYVINLSRGKIINTNDLVDGLKSGKVLGACLDVLEYEKSSFENIEFDKLPEAFKYLIDSEKVVLTPHVGGWTKESYYKLSKVLADKIRSFHHKP